MLDGSCSSRSPPKVRIVAFHEKLSGAPLVASQLKANFKFVIYRSFPIERCTAKYASRLGTVIITLRITLT